jgi:hypothetical protein
MSSAGQFSGAVLAGEGGGYFYAGQSRDTERTVERAYRRAVGFVCVELDQGGGVGEDAHRPSDT